MELNANNATPEVPVFNPSEQDVSAICGAVFTTLFDVEPTFLGDAAGVPQPDASHRPFAAMVHINGSVDAAVILHACEDFARLAASRMFRIDPADATDLDLQDALGEVSNVVGGQIKSLVPEPCTLSLPSVIEGWDYAFRLPGSRLTAEYAVEVVGCQLVIKLWQSKLPQVGSPRYTHRLAS